MKVGDQRGRLSLRFIKRLASAGLLLPLFASCVSPKPISRSFVALELPLPPSPQQPKLSLSVRQLLMSDTTSLHGTGFLGAAGSPAAPYVARESSSEDLRCLAEAVYYEARSEAEAGQRAVAQVVLNRVRHPAYPASICGVVYEGSEQPTGCQFSFTCDGSRARMREKYAWTEATRIAEDALSGYVFGPVGYATHYHTKAIAPEWFESLRRLGAVGEHIFYRAAGRDGDADAFTRS